MITEKTTPEGELVIQIVAMPKDTNANGDIFGGWLVSHMDMGAAISARWRAKCAVVTVAIDALTFYKPVGVGDTVCCYASVVKVGNTSIKIYLEVWTVSLNHSQPQFVAKGDFTFVAIDKDGRPQPVNR